MFCQLFIEGKALIRYVSEASYFQQILDTRPHQFPLEEAMSRPGCFQIQISLHAIISQEYCMQNNLFHTARDYNSKVQLRNADQIVRNNRNIWKQTAKLLNTKVLLEPYTFYNSRLVIFEDICCVEEWYELQLQQPFYAGSDRTVVSCDAGNRASAQKALEHNYAQPAGLPYNASAMFIKLHMLVESSQLYTLKDEELCN